MPRESPADRKVRTKTIIRLLKKEYPDAGCSLNYSNVHQLMVATILSAQCTDERVNMTTPSLFRKYRSVRAFANADRAELEEMIFATGFYKNKAKSIINSAKQVLKKHKGKVPGTLKDLVELPGVGRKTASVILGVGFGIAEGVVVDTHVSRISGLLGLTEHKDAVKIEHDLMKTVPRNRWIVWSHLLIYHGRSICIARRPRCAACCLKKHCPSAQISSASVS